MQNFPNRSDVTEFPQGFEIIPARSTTEAEPDYIIPTGKATRVYTYTKTSGTVSTLALTMWAYVDGEWYAQSDTDDGDSLTSGNQVREWVVHPNTLIGFTVSTISGGGTVRVLVRGFE